MPRDTCESFEPSIVLTRHTSQPRSISKCTTQVGRRPHRLLSLLRTRAQGARRHVSRLPNTNRHRHPALLGMRARAAVPLTRRSGARARALSLSLSLSRRRLDTRWARSLVEALALSRLSRLRTSARAPSPEAGGDDLHTPGRDGVLRSSSPVVQLPRRHAEVR